MVREIVPISVGGCGINMMQTHWESLLQEHFIGYDGLPTGDSASARLNPYEDLNIFFDEGNEGRRTFRGVLADLDIQTIDKARSKPWAKLYNPTALVGSGKSSGNIWAVGHYTDGAFLVDSIMDEVRLQAEKADKLQGFLFMHALAGGTGSGMGTLIASKTRECYPDRMSYNFTNVSSDSVDIAVAPYNIILSIHQLTENNDFVNFLDNIAMENILFREQPIKRATFDDLNKLSQHAISGLTASMRFGGQLNVDLRKMAVNLIPYPRLHYFSVTNSSKSIAGLSSADLSKASAELLHRTFDSRSSMSGVNTMKGRIISMSTQYRGPVSTYGMESGALNVQNKNSGKFIEWVSNNILESYCHRPIAPNTISCTSFVNSCSISEILRNIQKLYTCQFRRRAFLHWYTGEGMDAMEFTEAEANLDDLVSEYMQYSVAGIRNEEEEDEEEEA